MTDEIEHDTRIVDSGLLYRVTLQDPMNNRATVDIYSYGQQFEVITVAFNSSVPARSVGTFEQCVAKSERWMDTMRKAGFVPIFTI